MKTAAYCRVSADYEQNMRSLENQVRAYLDRIVRKRGWTLVGIYTDPGKSGTSIRQRPGFSRLLAHCEQRRIDLILTKSISRFSRNTEDFLHVVRRLRELQVDVLFERENIRLSETRDEFLLTMFAAVAQHESVNLSRNVQWGYEKRFLRGIAKAAPILGYETIRENGQQTFQIVPEESAIVLDIFTRFLQGDTLTGICRDLGRRGVPTKSGHTQWIPSYLRYILSNTRYTGEVDAGTYPSTIRHLRPDDPEKKPIRIPNSHPVIIDREMFCQAQQRLAERKQTTPRKPASRLPLSGRLVCGHCGRNFQLYNNVSHRRSWCCAGVRLPHSQCTCEPVRETAVLENIRLAFMRRFGRSDDPLDRARELLGYDCHLDTLEASRLVHIQKIIATRSSTDNCQYGQSPKERWAEKEYLQFEARSKALEEDRPHFANARALLAKSPAWESFLNDLTLPLTRAFVHQIVLVAPEICCVRWWDETETWVGDTSQVAALTNAVASRDRVRAPSDRRESGRNPNAYSHKTVHPVVPGLNLWQKQDYRNQYRSLTDPPGPVRVCAYCRVSTKEDGQIASLAAQMAYYAHLILENPGWTFAGLYVDRGISGTGTRKRAEFNRMIRDARAGLFDRIVTKSVSRFSRNCVDTLALSRELKGLSTPVHIFFENEGIDTGSLQGELALSVCASLAQEEAQSLSENVKWGLRQTVVQGNYKHSGKTAFGYTRDEDGHWVVHKENAETVRTIFQGICSGMTLSDVARSLSDARVPSETGKTRWHPGMISSIVHNRSYTGHLLFQKSYVKNYLDHRPVRNWGEKNQYILENHHEPLIDEVTWQKAVALLESRDRGTKGTAGTHDHPELAGKLFCSICGSQISHFSVTREYGTTHYWRCRDAKTKPPGTSCKAGNLREENIEYAFMEMLTRLRDEPEWFQQAAHNIQEQTPGPEQKARQKEIARTLVTLYRTIHDLTQVPTEDPLVLRRIEETMTTIFTLRAEAQSLEDVSLTIARHKELLSKSQKQTLRLPYLQARKETLPYDPEIFDAIVQSATACPDSITFVLIWNIAITITIDGLQAWKLPHCIMPDE